MATNEITAIDMVYPQVGSDYVEAEIMKALGFAYSYANSLDKDNDIVKTSASANNWSDYVITDEGQATGVTMLAAAVLINGRVSINTGIYNILPKSIEVLATQEIRDMILTADQTDEETVEENVMWSNITPTADWEVY